MKPSEFCYEFEISDNDQERISGRICLDDPVKDDEELVYRAGCCELDSGQNVELNLTHSAATAGFIYTHECELTPGFFEIVGLEPDIDWDGIKRITLPGQLVMGAERTRLIGRGVRDTLKAPCLREMMEGGSQENVVAISVLREGIKYQIADAILDTYGYFCDEVLTDAHHTLDETVSSYRRRVLISLFKDDDLTGDQRELVLFRLPDP